MNRRQFIALGIAASGSLLCAPYAFAQVANINDAINKAGRQRMLSQRLAKCYMQIGQAVEADRSKKILDTSLALFDRQLVELKAFAPSAENKTLLVSLEKAWISYKDILVGKVPNQTDAKIVLTLSDEVLVLAHEATVQLERIAGGTTGKLVNIAGRQRMLSQRMAKHYQAINWSVPGPGMMEKLIAARKEFVDGMGVLSGFPSNTQAIQKELELGKEQWAFFDHALGNRTGSASNKMLMATNVATTSERILEVMDRVTDLYAKLA